jgi:hypothetical protein
VDYPGEVCLNFCAAKAFYELQYNAVKTKQVQSGIKKAMNSFVAMFMNFLLNSFYIESAYVVARYFH